MPRDPAELVTPILDGLLSPDEQLRGWCLAAEQSTSSGHTTILGVTDQRLVLQAVDRKFRPKDDALSILPGELAGADADGAGGAWWTTTAAIMDSAALKVRLETTTGATRTLTMMRGTGMFGKLGGGDAQRQGIEALADWLRAAG
jgi:hypothetical protein